MPSSMMLVSYLLLICIFLTSHFWEVSTTGKVKEEDALKLKLPPCRACKTLVESFKKGLERTSRGFEGGDTAWEEKNLGSYATSEVRLVEIHEKLCTNIVEGRDQCYALLEEYDEILEQWWFKKQTDYPDLQTYLCIDQMQACCPAGHFGKDCTPCEGFPDHICFNNGKCKGDGTRKGTGKCQCDQGYTGEKCDSCIEGFYESYRDANKVLCTICHASCDGGCIKAGPDGCIKCKIGFMQNKDRACRDVNECIMGKDTCKSTEFCVNTEGSYKCMKCHDSCLSCKGDAPDECIECAEGYRRKGNLCVHIEGEDRQNYISTTRYITYFGLCVCTCIIFQKNTYLAAIVGIFVAVYITLSEYFVNSPGFPVDELKDQLNEQLQKAFGRH
ncbi:cysteine-rich with EGF-like domain protein 2 [Anthonomus grandis grandis]|uniref:cysteine-rich with EGF-like domain protein 2 n=1 Tax=Anthonomus grandis grandis TaxID=2921223 RepID=UPI002165D2E7|nr:cysteine-rich with EGF-like domain protein 2 [Anthonomus grandis grandis]